MNSMDVEEGASQAGKETPKDGMYLSAAFLFEVAEKAKVALDGLHVPSHRHAGTSGRTGCLGLWASFRARPAQCGLQLLPVQRCVRKLIDVCWFERKCRGPIDFVLANDSGNDRW